MITYTSDQRRSVRWDGPSSNWKEEVLAASGVEASATGFTVVAGANVQLQLESIDNVLSGINYSTCSGVIAIDDVANISGTTSETLDNLDLLTLPSGANSAFRFSFGVPAQPTAPVIMRVSAMPRVSGVSGNLKLNLDYNIFEHGASDLTPGGVYAYSKTATQSLTSGQYEKAQLINIQMETTDFSTQGSAPYIVNCKVTRDVSVGSNYAGNVSIAQLYIDNVPGGSTGNQAGYVGGNLYVSGDLTVSGLAILQGGTPPASGTANGTAGTFIIDNNFLYAAVNANVWKRVALGKF